MAVDNMNTAPAPRAGLVLAAGRVLALLLGGFAMLNLAGDVWAAGFNANIWWIDLRPLSSAWAGLILAASSLLLIAFAVRPHGTPRRMILTQTLLVVLLIAAGLNTAYFYRLVSCSIIRTSVPVPLSLLVIAALGLIFAAVRAARTPPPAGAKPRWRAMAVVAAAMIVGFPLAQILFFGQTDYRRAADVIVVFGGGVYPDGRCSDALADRVRTACDLYREGCAPRLILSGGPGMGPVHETEGMRRLALACGVPERAILVDTDGFSTQATVRNTVPLIARLKAGRVLAVSHAYHLPRIKMTYQRAGVDVYTVPARETCTLRAMPWYVAREVAALWLYYINPLAGETP